MKLLRAYLAARREIIGYYRPDVWLLSVIPDDAPCIMVFGKPDLCEFYALSLKIRNFFISLVMNLPFGEEIWQREAEVSRVIVYNTYDRLFG